MVLMAFFAAGHLLVVLADSYGQVMLGRFLGGIPHGAFFGIGALVAASLVSHERRTAAIATMLGGLGVANVVGVPLATYEISDVSRHGLASGRSHGAWAS